MLPGRLSAMPWLFPIIAYLVGSIPFGVLIAKSKGIDITQHGSGNVGATNVFRVVGKGFGILCLFLDFLKGFVPVVIAINLLRVQGETPPVPLPFLWGLSDEISIDRQLAIHTSQVATAMAAILGHNYSLFLRGKGGKGIATSAGVLVALMPLVLLVDLPAIVLITMLAAISKPLVLQDCMHTGAVSRERTPILSHLL